MHVLRMNYKMKIKIINLTSHRRKRLLYWNGLCKKTGASETAFPPHDSYDKIIRKDKLSDSY